MWGAVIPVKTIAQTPILNKIYTKTLKNRPHTPFSPKTHLNHLKDRLKGIILFNTKCINNFFKVD